MCFFKKCEICLDWILKIGFVASSIFILYIMMSICVSIVMRYFFHRPILWVIGVAEQLLIIVCFFTAAWALKREKHVRMDLLLSRLKPRYQALMNVITFAISSLICLVIVWYSAKVALEHYRTGIFSRTVLDIPSAPSLAIISFGSFLLAMQFLRSAVKFYVEGWKSEALLKEN